MVQTRHEVPDFEVRMRIDADPVTSLRAQLKAEGPALLPSVNDFIVKAAALALREHPRANGSYQGDTWQLYDRVNVGIAVATEGGLIVPTIFDADVKSVGEIARVARELAERAREGRIALHELDGGTFTVSNLGMFGVDSFSAIITPPQAAILAVGAIVEEPVVRDGAVVPGRVMELALSCDHRILYGADAAQLLARIRELLVRPISLLLS
jgi:pyruvate dehydrogenase E2 component (dihydrolipoamide acetyltransferase)